MFRILKEYQERFHQMSHEVFDELQNFVGEHVWNFADFETNSYALIRIQRKPQRIIHKE